MIGGEREKEVRDQRLEKLGSPPEVKSASYHRTHRILAVSSYVADILVLLALLFTGWSIELRDVAEHLSSAPVAAMLIYAVLIGAILKIISLPFDYLSGFWLEHRYELSNLTARGWLKDEAKGMLVAGVLGALALELVYGCLRAWPQNWWLIAGAVLTVFFVVMANLAPVLILPLFVKLKPLDYPSLEQRLRRMAEGAGTRVQGIYEWKLGEKTKKANAALTGLGNTRRILVADTLLQGFSEEEIESVLAHELGHHVHGDIWRGLAVNTAATFLGLYLISVALTRWSPGLGFRGASDFANLPLVVLVTLAVSLFLLPLMNGLSRSRKRAADAYAVRSIPDPAVFVSSL